MSKWISVSERLPEDGVDVLAWDGEYFKVAWYYYDDEMWYDDYDLEWLDVIAWMMIPEPGIELLPSTSEDSDAIYEVDE